jgi:hypothetical protein
LRLRFALIGMLAILGTLTASAEGRVENADGTVTINGVGPFFEVGFLVVRSTTNYDDALRFARHASRLLELPLDLRGLVHDPTHGLTWSREICAEDPLYPFPCYLARGRWEGSTKYVSIERSDAYRSMRGGLYVVIVATGDPEEIARFAASVREKISDAYAKRADVYHGCMH